MQETTDTTKIWQEYDKGLYYLNGKNFFSKVEKSYQFAEGDQWGGLESGGMPMPQLNFLRPTMKYGVAIVAQNAMTINYSSMDYNPASRQTTVDVCDKLNKHASATWERLKMDSMTWSIIQNAYISGDSFVYFDYKDNTLIMESIDNTNVLLADEQNPNIQEQPYILIVQRKYVADVKKEAEANGIEQADIDLILPDDNTEYQINAKEEVKNDKKCTVVLKMYKENGEVWTAKSTKTVIYQKAAAIKPKAEEGSLYYGKDLKGISLYPIAKYCWQNEHGSARGLGDIYDKINNQIEVNKGIARLCIAAKEFSFPQRIYDNTKITGQDVKNLNVVGSSIGFNGFNGQQSISNVVGYLQAANINPLAKDIVTDLISQTRELAGAGDSVTGQVNPEQASGAAIIAVQDAAALPLNMQVSAYKQFIEDIALIWFDMWAAYNPNGLDIVDDKEGIQIPIDGKVLQEMKVNVRIDVSPTNPYSKYAQEQGLTNLFTSQAVTFEEFVNALDDDSSLPKAKLLEILEQRKAAQQEQAAMIIQQLSAENEQLKQQLASEPQRIEQAVQIGAKKQAEQTQKKQTVQQMQQLAARN